MSDAEQPEDVPIVDQDAKNEGDVDPNDEVRQAVTVDMSRDSMVLQDLARGGTDTRFADYRKRSRP